MFGHDSEKQLTIRLRNGDAKAMRDFYALYAGRLTATCSRYVTDEDDVKDVLQDSMLLIVRNIDRFEYRGKGSLLAWATRIVVSRAVDFVKRRARLDTVSLDRDVSLDTGDDPECDVGGVPPEALHEMLRQLPDGYRTVLNLYVVEEKSHREIAQMLGIKEVTSASQLHRAKHLLAAKIKQYRNNKSLRT